MSQTIQVDNYTISVSVPTEPQTIVVGEDVQIQMQNIEPKVVIDNSPITVTIESGGFVPSSQGIVLVAGTNISALRAITTNVNGEAVYASNNTLANAQVIGISDTGAVAGSPVTIKTSDTISDLSWNWTKGTVFLGTNGVLTQVAPTGGAVLVHVGRAITPTTLLIDIDTIIQTI